MLPLRGVAILTSISLRVPKKILGPKRDEVTWEWSIVQKEGLYDMYFSPDIFRVIKSRRMILIGPSPLV
jgi:hypothetical protein